jgi:hypothetical protein
MTFFYRPLLLAILVLLGAGAKQRPAPTYPWFAFTWYSAKLKGKEYRVAMLIPVKVRDLPGNFVTQFDLGSDATVLYEQAIRNYFASRAQLYAQVDTTRRGTTDTGTVHYHTTGLPLTFGGARVAHPLLYAKYGEAVPLDSLRTPSTKLVGTIGGDFLAGKVLVIDYPRQRMCVLDSVDAYWRARTAFVGSRVKNNRMQIPLTVKGRTHWVLFDTGASLFSLTTAEPTWQSLVRPGPPTDTLVVGSWGKQVPFYAAPVQAPVYLGHHRLPAAAAWFTRDQRHLDFMKAEQIDAVTGNAFFQQRIVVLDFKQRRFGVVR